MKTTCFSLALLSTSTLASVETMLSGMEDSLATLQAEEAAQGNSPKEFPFFLQAYLGAIDGYGCWCNFDEDHYKGKGTPVNSIDGHCKALVLGYECIIMDGEAENVTCDTPWAEAYVPHNVALTATTSVIDQCAANNAGNNCHIRACIVEGTFTEVIFADFINSVVYDPNYKHGGAFFDPAVNCVLGGGSGEASEKDCCGDYPFRFPFKTFNDERQCCGQKTYNIFNHCCADEGTSTLAAAGNC